MFMPICITWVVVATPVRCRALEERRRGAELRELAFWDRSQTEADRRHAHHELAEERQRAGFACPPFNLRDLKDEAERRFLARYANQLRLAAAQGRYERLILLASPRPLGMLRKELGRVGERRLEGAWALDGADAPPEALRRWLRELRSSS